MLAHTHLFVSICAVALNMLTLFDVMSRILVNSIQQVLQLFQVMLLSCPELEDLYHKSCSLSEDAADVQENFVHPTRLIHFLVGVKGKNETMAIGGAWSPSQDGLNPDEDPKVLIKTAIRTTKALTGIDLSACTQWLVAK